MRRGVTRSVAGRLSLPNTKNLVMQRVGICRFLSPQAPSISIGRLGQCPHIHAGARSMARENCSGSHMRGLEQPWSRARPSTTEYEKAKSACASIPFLHRYAFGAFVQILNVSCLSRAIVFLLLLLFFYYVLLRQAATTASVNCVLFLFEGAAVDTRTKYTFAAIGAFLMGFASEMIR